MTTQHAALIEAMMQALGLTDDVTEDEARDLLGGCDCNGEEGSLHLLWHIVQQRDRLREQWDAVLAHINDRPGYITALKNTRGDDLSDYYRWSGHAEARRQLATTLGLTVPHNPGDRALAGAEEADHA